MKIRKEIRQALEEEGYSREEIEKDLNNLVEQEIQRQDKLEREEIQRQDKLESEEREKIRQHEIELKKLEMQQELDMKSLEFDNGSNTNTTQMVERREKIQSYDEKGDLDSWFKYFEEATSDWTEEKRKFELKKAFLITSVSKHIGGLDNINEIYKIIYNHYKLTSEEYRKKFRDGKYDSNKSVESYVADQKLNMNKWIGSIVEEESTDSIKNLFLKEQIYNGFDRDVQRRLVEFSFYDKDMNDIVAFLKNYIQARPISRSETSTRPNHSGNSRIQCYICKGFGHLSNNCSNNKFTRNTTSSWRGRGRGNKLYSQKLNQISELSSDENKVNENYERQEREMVYHINSINANEIKEKLPITKGTVNGKPASRALRDTGCTTIIVHNKFIDVLDENSSKEIKLPDGRIINTKTALVEIDCPYYKGKFNASIMDTEFDIIIGNVPFAKCACHEECMTEIDHEDIEKLLLFSNNDQNEDGQPDFVFKEKQVEDEELKYAWKLCYENKKDKDGAIYIIEKELLFRIYEGAKQLCIPKQYTGKVLTTAHDNVYSGHLAENKTFERIKRLFFWPGMREDVKRHCNICHICQKKNIKNPQKVPLKPIKVTSEPFHMVGMDLIGPLNITKRRNRFILSIIDYTTKYPIAIPLPNKRTKCVASALRRAFAMLGFPRIIISDQEPSFVSEIMRTFYKEMGIEAKYSSPYHPETNGLVENFQKTFKIMLNKFANEEKQWDELIEPLLFAYRQSPHLSTGYSPFELLFAHEVNGPLNILIQEWTNMNKNKEENIEKYFEKTKERDKG